MVRCESLGLLEQAKTPRMAVLVVAAVQHPQLLLLLLTVAENGCDVTALGDCSTDAAAGPAMPAGGCGSARQKSG